MLEIWAELGICLAVIAVAGTKLSRYGDIIASKTGMTGNWIGLILMATVTSLPELATGLSAVTIGDAPNIAVGDLLGSCVFNLLLLALIDIVRRERPFYSEISDSHGLTAAFGIALIGIVGVGLTSAPLPGARAFGHVGIITPLLIVGYGYAMWVVFVRERVANSEGTGELIDRYPETTLRTALSRYAIAAVFVVGAGIWLPFIGRDLAIAMGWSTSFVGTLLIAAITSAPELVVSMSAVRIGAIDMAAGNLLGSNLFNMLVLAIDDLAFVKGPILAEVDSVHANSAFTAAIMAAIVTAALLARPQRRFRGVPGVPSIALMAAYLVNGWALYAGG
ncbi:MAG: sodium:calcium antiporter [Dongiaceae bacterium]